MKTRPHIFRSIGSNGDLSSEESTLTERLEQIEIDNSTELVEPPNVTAAVFGEVKGQDGNDAPRCEPVTDATRYHVITSRLQTQEYWNVLALSHSCFALSD